MKTQTKQTIKNAGIAIAMSFVMITANAQNLSQTIRGQVVDEDSKTEVIGASVLVLGSQPILGSMTDMEGAFKISHVPVGRVDLKISCLGFDEKMIPNVLITAGKEIVLTIELAESVSKLEEITITSSSSTGDKSETINEMAEVSAKAFTVEETNRYAGAINDPARMVSAFAGVQESPYGNNDIIVRGNSPRGILWRLEGVEIPNPNHFAGEGKTGGPINALNSAMLSNSDFYSGAFAPEYGNAYSGVLDMKLRNGNNEKREYSFSAGVLGTDFTAEGPFAKGKEASFLVNYRYATLNILDKLKLVNFQGVPKYQDASFKVYLPTEKKGVFTFFGLGGKSNILQQDKEDEIVYATNNFGAHLGVLGINHLYVISDKTYLKNSISFSKTLTDGNQESRDEKGEYFTYYDDMFSKTATRISSTLSYKFNSKNRLVSGIIYTFNTYNMLSKYHDYNANQLFTGLETSGNTGLIQAFSSWKYRINTNLTLVSGFHFTQLLLNNNYSLEPRASLKYQLDPKQSLTAGIGIHSKVETISIYMANSNPDGNEVTQPNRDLEFAKARHYVLGYSNLISENLNFKAECYYQDLYNVPVFNDVTKPFSMLNMESSYINDKLVNEGTGSNYGTELTLERFFANNYYFLVTASLYESTFKALDGIKRKSIYDGNYAGNVLAGKEFKIGKPEKSRTLSLNARVSLIGGTRFTPIDLEQSIAEHHQVFNLEELYANKGSDIFKADLSVSLRRNKGKTSRELKCEVRNATNSRGLVSQYYNDRKQTVENLYQQPLMPLISYTINF